MIAHCGFKSYIPVRTGVEYLLIGLFNIGDLLWKCLMFCPLCNWIALYIFDLNLLSDVCIVSIFSQCMACLFTFLMMSFIDRILIKPHLSILSFMG